MLHDAIEKVLGPSLHFYLGIYVGKLCGLQSPFPRQAALNLAMHYVQMSKIEGDYLEFGVWQGNSFSAACYLAGKRKLAMNFYAFDSFQGLPENQEKDSSGHRMYTPGTFDCSEQQFLKNVKRRGADMSRVITVPGWFEDSLRPENPKLANLRKAAVAWVDCDLYSSTASVLNFLTDRLQYGALVFFDDWLGHRADANCGEQRAFREWLAANPHISVVEFVRMGWVGNSFVVHDSGSSSLHSPVAGQSAA